MQARTLVPVVAVLVLAVGCADDGPDVVDPPGDTAVTLEVLAVPLPEVRTTLAHTCALASDSTAYCWGWDTSGQLGQTDPSPTDCLNGGSPTECRLTPTAVDEIPGPSARLFGSSGNNCLLDPAGLPYCWGYNARGNLLHGRTGVRPPQPADTNLRFVQLAGGHMHMCGIISDGRVYCWGANDAGQLGVGTIDIQTFNATPDTVAAHLRATFVGVSNSGSAFNGTVCATSTGGSTYCWGSNVAGQVGIGGDTSEPITTPQLISTPVPLVILDLGAFHACGLDANGKAYCWGSNGRGELGQDTTALDSCNNRYDAGVSNTVYRGSCAPAPIQVHSDLRFTDISAGYYRTCGITTSGQAVCWGLAFEGPDFSTSPVDIAPGVTFRLISADGWGHGCAVSEADEIYCWGRNNFGMVGNGTTEFQPDPVLIQLP